MPHFLIKQEQIKDEIITFFEDDNFFHITKSLRAKTGETIKFIDEAQNVYLSKIFEINKKTLKAKIIEQYKSDRVLKNNICLIQSILMNEAQTLLIANATQTGVKEIYPVISDNTSVSFSSLKNKEEKWTKTAYENFKQCERADMPKINKIAKLKDVLSEFKKENVIVYAEKYAQYSAINAVKDIDTKEKIAIVIGPEGGFSENEFEYFKKENYKLTSLGSMIYKAPNAVVAGIYGIVSILENNL